MHKLHNLIFKNVRCFASQFDVPIAPLTFLVGDNSSGKSTFLAMYRIAWDLSRGGGARRINFNEEPFLLGGYDQIATYRGGRYGRASHFEVGMRLPPKGVQQRQLFMTDDPKNTDLLVRFERSGSHPVITEERLSSGPVALTITRPLQSPIGFELAYNNQKFDLQWDEEASPLRFLDRDMSSDFMILSYVFSAQNRKNDRNNDGGKRIPSEALEMLEQLLRSTRGRSPEPPIACAPVRTKPERVYTPISDAPLPEGGHVPMVLARMFFEDKPKWQKTKESLDLFGQGAGLFRSIEIKSLGRHEGDPFQLRFKLDGPATNLLDVGYGVSQILPILVDALLAKQDQTYLMQQPEVHLHPKGQAELGSFLANLVATQRRRFIVETHSDFLIDRVRMDIRDGKGVSHEDAQILFFDRSSGELKIHSINFDKRGGLVNPPPSYREFFLQEEDRFLFGQET